MTTQRLHCIHSQTPHIVFILKHHTTASGSPQTFKYLLTSYSLYQLVASRLNQFFPPWLVCFSSFVFMAASDGIVSLLQ